MPESRPRPARLDWSRWPEIDALFARTLDQSPTARESFLEHATTDPVLREAVRQLLAADSDDDAGALVVARDLAVDALHAAVAEGVPEVIGPFRVLREIGRGGMGTVYLGERATDAFVQQVAIKRLRRGVDTDDVLRRFGMERRILATLRHPNIAALIDGGCTDDGRPWLAMEYVNGVPLPVHCAQQAISVRERILLVRQVALAVQEAHRNLIIHRDIKPSNVLVTADGQPKLLDFGIAKLLDRSDGEFGGDETRSGIRLLTPRYAAPEQRNGEPVTVATDVYQLGLLLAETIEGAGPPEALGDILARRPARDDLSRIVMMATREEPLRRYPTAAAFVDDLDRWLDRRPVVAQPDSWRYRGGRFLARHRWVAPAASLLLLLSAGWMVSAAQQRAQLVAERDTSRMAALRADRERERAVTAQRGADAERLRALEAQERADSLRLMATDRRAESEAARARADSSLQRAVLENRRAEEVTRFLVQLFESANIAATPRADTLSARTLLVRGAARVRSELADQPLVLARLLHTMGTLHLSMGIAGHEVLFSDAVALERTHRGPRTREVMRLLAEQGRRYCSSRNFALGAPRLAEAIAIARPLPPFPPDSLSAMLSSYGGCIMELDDLSGADAALREALSLTVRGHGPSSPRSWEIRTTQAMLYRRQNRLDEALIAYDEILAAQRADPRTPPLWLAATLNSLGFLHRTKEAWEPGERAYREAYEIQLEHEAPTSRATFVTANNLAALLSASGQHAAAAEVASRELARTKRYFPPDHFQIGSALNVVASIFEFAGQAMMAEQPRRESLDVYTRSLGANHSWTLRAQVQLGQLLQQLGRYDEAEATLRAADSLAVAVADAAAQPATQAAIREALAALRGARERHLAADSSRFGGREHW
jgi:eukaryotic-like serine/threonine-protein kinase